MLPAKLSERRQLYLFLDLKPLTSSMIGISGGAAIRQPPTQGARSYARAAFLFGCPPRLSAGGISSLPIYRVIEHMNPLRRQAFKALTTEELIALLSAVAPAILAVIIISMVYFGRDIFVPVALAILLSFVLAPLVGIL